MKIAQVVSTFPPYYGGTGNAVFCISRELAKLGHEVTVFTPTQNVIPTRASEVEESIKETSKGSLDFARDDKLFRVVRIKQVIKIGNAAWVPQLLWKLRGFDVMHLHAPFIGAEAVAKRYLILDVMPNLFRHLLKILKSSSATKLRKGRQVQDDDKQKLIITYHHDLIGPGFRGILFGFWNKCILPLVLRISDKVIGSSLDYIANSNAGRYYKSHSQKFIGIPFGVDTEKFFRKKNLTR